MENSSLSFGRFSPANGKLSNGSQDRLCDFLRTRHPLKTAECVEDATDGLVKAATVRKWLDGSSQPSFKAFCALISVYGAEYIEAVVLHAPQTIRDAASVERDMRYEQKLRELQSEFRINR